MSFLVSVSRPATIHQGLLSPVRAATRLPPLESPVGSGRPVELRIAVAFDDDDVAGSGWLLDTDALAEMVDRECRWLESAPWTQLFRQRPTMETVSRDVFRRLQADVEHLVHVELADLLLGVVTRYQHDPEETA